MYPAVDMEEVRRRNRSALKTALLAYFLVGTVVAVLIPESLLQPAPIAQALRWFDPLVPGIPRLASISPLPDLMRLFLIVMWLLMPVAAYRVGMAWHWNPRTFVLRKSDQWFLVGVIWTIAAFAFAFLFFFVEVSPSSLDGGGRGKAFVRLLTQYRFGIGIVGSLYFCIIATTIGLAIRLIYLVVSGRGAAVANAS